MIKSVSNFPFLKGGGEMGELARRKDWSTTPVGTPDRWPHSLQTAVSILLNSQFPMFVWWGKEELTTIYNDSYKIIAGNKHPELLGKSGREGWSEIWDELAPLVNKVFKGESTWSDDLLLYVERRGFIEPAYFTFSYSPILDDTGSVRGLFCAVIETTEKVENKKSLEESRTQLAFALNATGLATWDYNPVTDIAHGNQRFRDWFNLGNDPVIKISSAMDVISDADKPRVLAAVEKSFNISSGGAYDIQYSIIDAQTKKERIVRAKGQTRFNENGDAIRFTGTLQDITEQVVARRKIEESERNLRNIIQQAPFAACILRGKNFIVDVVNSEMLAVWDKRVEEILGKPLFEVLHQSANRGYEELFTGVYETGEELSLQETAVPLLRKGKLETCHFNIRYRPIREYDGSISGIMAVSVEVTEQVKNRRRIEESEQKLRNLILRSPAAICIVSGPAFVVEIANEKMYEIWDRKPEDVLNKPVFEAMPDVANQGYEAILKKVFTTGETYNIYGAPLNILRNGKLESIYVNVAYDAMKEIDGTISGVIAITTDVTEQVLARKKIEESEQRVRAIVESAPFPIATYIGKEMRIQMANQAITDVWGKGSDVIGKLYSELLPELENQEVFEQLDRVYTTGIPFNARNQRLELIVDGQLKPFYFNYSFTPLFDAAGNVYGVMNTAADVTDLNVAKQLIEESETKFRSMVEQVPVAIALTRGKDLLIEGLNTPMQRFLVKNGQDAIGKRILDVLPELESQQVLSIVEMVLEKGQPFSGAEYPIKLETDGELKQYFFNLSYTPLIEDGHIVGVLHSALDVTEQVLARKKIEESEAELQKRVEARTQELAIAIKELQRSNAHLEEFAHAASHDLKEPIRKIHFYTDRLKSQLSAKLSSDDNRMFERVEHASQRMNSLIDDLLLYSHVSQLPQEKETVDLNSKLLLVQEDLELDILEKGAKINIGKLPIVRGYRRQLQQLFHNLLTNALKYSKPGIVPHIEITSRIEKGIEAGLIPERNYHLITVKDNGIGFEQEHAEKIFQMFQRLHGKKEYEGTGVGLSIAQKVAENHEGKITAESEPGNGATFKVYLPVEDVDSSVSQFK